MPGLLMLFIVHLWWATTNWIINFKPHCIRHCITSLLGVTFLHCHVDWCNINSCLPIWIDYCTATNTYQGMELRLYALVILLFSLVWITETMSQSSNVLKSRKVRSPRGNLKLCNSAFVNFAKFKLRGCPPPRLCSLSRPLKKRYCVRENAPKKYQKDTYFPRNKT